MFLQSGSLCASAFTHSATCPRALGSSAFPPSHVFAATDGAKVFPLGIFDGASNEFAPGTPEKHVDVPLRRKEFDRDGIWTQFDLLAGGLGTSPSYGQGYAMQVMLLFDKLDMAGKTLAWLANTTYDPVPGYKLRRDSPYYFYERAYSFDPADKVNLDEGCGALNLVNVSEPLKVARLLLGVDDLDPELVRIIPRPLPIGREWKRRTRPYGQGEARSGLAFSLKDVGRGPN
jgi:hypothetical protein